MALSDGMRLGPYEVIGLLGAGGMGEVHRARDTRLGREVAIKALPDGLAADGEYLARFGREAQILASLNHPNIAAIHGVEEQDGQRYLVLELVPGETLAERIASGLMPLEDALAICRQIAEALEAAHEKGIIHRDLKPANVKITPDGKVKVLDFGLAKDLAVAATTGSGAGLSRSPTISMAATRAGVIFGTAAYMSPEQARGKPVDKRTDIWAFGCVLYETLTGRAAFDGETVTDIIGSIVKTDPDWAALPPSTPPKVRALVRRCLQKNPSLRLRDIGDGRIEIDEALSEPAAEPAAAAPASIPAAKPARPWLWPSVAVLAAAITGTAVWLFTRPQPLPRPVTRAMVTVAGAELGMSSGPAVVLSPDGQNLVYVASRAGVRQLYLRPLNRADAQPMAGTEAAWGPFFSFDGQWVGFMADGKLKKVPVSGGAPITLCEAPNARGATWLPDNTIVLGSVNSGLLRVPAAGGKPELITTLQKAETGHRFPAALPGAEAVLFTINGGLGSQVEMAKIAVLPLNEAGKEKQERRVLAEGGSHPHYIAGHVIYLGASGLLAVPFDSTALKLTGTPFPVLENVASTSGSAHFAVSGEQARNAGTGDAMVYIPGGTITAGRALVWVNRSGVPAPVSDTLRRFSLPRLSPDGRQLLVEIAETPHSIWNFDLTRQVLTRLTFEEGSHTPLFSTDGKRVAYFSDKAQGRRLTLKAADGSGSEEVVAEVSSSGNSRLSSWSPDGKMIAFHQAGDIWLVDMEGKAPLQPRKFLQSAALELNPRFSPDSRWLAYESNESGRLQVYVQSPSGTAGKWQISTDGGQEPVWSRNGKELFYRNAGKLMVAAVTLAPAFTASTPKPLFDAPYTSSAQPYGTQYDVTADGQRFVFIKEGSEQSSPDIELVLNWGQELKKAK